MNLPELSYGCSEIPKRFTVASYRFRNMLPSGIHCERCHALVGVLEVGLHPEEHPAEIVKLIQMHLGLVCLGGLWPTVDVVDGFRRQLGMPEVET